MWWSPFGGVWSAACAVLLGCGLGNPEPATDSPDAITQSPAMRPAAEAGVPETDKVRRRALLVGIDDYSASHLRPPADAKPEEGREVPSLEGATNDVAVMRELLILLYGFAPSDILTLTDQQATRQSILDTLEQKLVKPAAPGEVVLVYFGGHGSQRRNSKSDEPDGMDETLVPADSRLGAADITDKELRRRFNAILDKGARLTVLLDSCHSGSGARGLDSGAKPRGIKPDLRDLADGSEAGPRPEARGALVLSAAQDFDLAYETRGEDGQRHGAFSWALARAMRDAERGEPASELFLRAQARLRGETPNQNPAIAGNAETRSAPFLGDRTTRPEERTVVAVESVQGDDKVILQGGWAHGLTVGSQLELAGTQGSKVRLEVTALRGLGRCEARRLGGEARKGVAAASPPELKPGALLVVSGWASPPGPPLRVWIPRASGSSQGVVAWARDIERSAAREGVHWNDDPTEVTPTHLLRWHGQEWELLAPGRSPERLGVTPPVPSVLAKIPAGSSLFVQIPAPASLVQNLAIGPVCGHDGVELTERPEEADYVLAGRLAVDHVEYAWVRPLVGAADLGRSGLPPRSQWSPLDTPLGDARRYREPAPDLETAVFRLRKIYAWQNLSAPARAQPVYHLTVQRASDGRPVQDGVLVAGEGYSMVLRAPLAPPLAQAPSRYFYAFAIDSFGKSVLLFPTTSGSIENCFPLPCQPGRPQENPPREIPFGPPGSFHVSEPFGFDTYFLLATDEPLPNPWILEWEGVRTRGPAGKTPLEELLSVTGGASRSPERIVVPASWSIERVLFESRPATSVVTR